MLDVRRIRANPDLVREAIRLRGVNPAKANLDRWLELDAQRRLLQGALDDLNAEKNKLAHLGKTDPNAARARGQEMRARSRELEEQLVPLTREWQSILEWFPNFPHPAMPVGADDEDNVEESAWVPGSGYLPADALGKNAHSAPRMPQHPIHAGTDVFRAVHYADLGEKLGGVDTAQGSKVSGSRFAYLTGDIARMQIALQQLLTNHLLALEYAPIVPPLLVRERSLYGTSHFPEGRDQVYEIKPTNVEDGQALFLVGSSEPANFSYFMDRTLPEAELPVRIFAFTPCFRSEAGSWGKDIRGIKRLHQFDKLEMNAVCTGEQAASIYAEFLAVNEWLLQSLELPYHVIAKSTGDAGYLATHRQRDVEVWLSGLGEYMEVMTDTDTSDYQARRLNIRYKPLDGATQFANTVNDTGCAMGRMLIAIIDNYQQKDGSVMVPAVLRPIVGKEYLRPA